MRFVRKSELLVYCKKINKTFLYYIRRYIDLQFENNYEEDVGTYYLHFLFLRFLNIDKNVIIYIMYILLGMCWNYNFFMISHFL